MIVTFLVCIISLLVFVYICEQYRTRRQRKMIRDIPGMKGYPLIGSALEFGNNSVAYFNNVFDAVHKYGDIFHVWMGSSLFIILSDPKDVEVILSSTTHLHKSSLYKFFIDVLGLGLISSPVPKWRKHRKMLVPAFHFKILESYVDIMNDNTEIMMKLLEKEVGKEQFDIEPYISKYTLDIICSNAQSIITKKRVNRIKV